MNRNKQIDNAMAKAHLSLEGLTVAYDGVAVVHDADFALMPGKIGCLLGPSGCGKSTLLRAIAGFEPLLKGHIKINGNTISNHAKTLEPEKRNIGLVFQDLALFPHISIAENVAFGLQKWHRTQRQARVNQLLKLVGLPDVQDRYPHSLSGGQQQRIALIRAIAPKPQLLLMDEPFSGLDASMREELLPMVREVLIQEKITAILVTHDQLEAFSMADTVAIMNRGSIVQCDSPFNIYHKPSNRFTGNFIGKGDYVPGIIRDKHAVDSPLGTLNCAQLHGFAAGKSVDILIRPDNLIHDDDSSLQAEVVSKQFSGSYFIYRVKLISGHLLYCFAASHHSHRIGESIGIRVDLKHLIMFES